MFCICVIHKRCCCSSRKERVSCISHRIESLNELTIIIVMHKRMNNTCDARIRRPRSTYSTHTQTSWLLTHNTKHTKSRVLCIIIYKTPLLVCVSSVGVERNGREKEIVYFYCIVTVVCVNLGHMCVGSLKPRPKSATTTKEYLQTCFCCCKLSNNI